MMRSLLVLALLLVAAPAFAQTADQIERLWPESTDKNDWSSGDHTDVDEYWKADYIDYVTHTGTGLTADSLELVFSDMFDVSVVGDVDSARIIAWGSENAFGTKDVECNVDVGSGFSDVGDLTFNGTSPIPDTLLISAVNSTTTANALRISFRLGANLSSFYVRIHWVYVQVFHTRTIAGPTVTLYGNPDSLRSWSTPRLSCSLYVGSAPMDTIYMEMQETGSSYWRRVWGSYRFTDYADDPVFDQDTALSMGIALPYYDEEVDFRVVCKGRDGGADTDVVAIDVVPGQYDSLDFTEGATFSYINSANPTVNYGGLALAGLFHQKLVESAPTKYNQVAYLPGIAAPDGDSINYVLHVDNHATSASMSGQSVYINRSGKYFEIGAGFGGAASDSEVTWNSNLHNYETWTTGGGDWSVTDSGAVAGDSSSNKVDQFWPCTGVLEDGDSLLIIRLPRETNQNYVGNFMRLYMSYTPSPDAGFAARQSGVRVGYRQSGAVIGGRIPQ